jgi:Leucine-rich repeat (LRR) protein
MSGRPLPTAGSAMTSSQSQYERKLARQRQLEMMEATASGTAPTMELDTARWSIHDDHEDDGEMETLNIIQDDYETRRQSGIAPATSAKTRVVGGSVPSSATAGLFRPRDDVTGSNLNLMDHTTGRYSDQPTSFFGRVFGYGSNKYSHNAFRPPHHLDASPADDAYGGDMYTGSPSKPQRRRQQRSRLSIFTAVWYQTFCTKKNTRRTYAALFAVVAALVVALTVLTMASGSTARKDRKVYSENETRLQAFYDRFALVENITDAQTLDDTNSPEFHALRFIAYTDPGRLRVDDPHASHRYALVVFYYNSFVYFQIHAGKQKDIENPDMPQYEGIPNPGWTRRDYWLSDRGICSWWGIKCAPVYDADAGNFTVPVDGNFAVEEINLHHNHVFGVLVPELAALGGSLRRMDLGSNKMVGDLPDKAFQFLAAIESLDLSENSLTGTLPEGISAMKSLKVLDLSHNKLGGTLPADIGEMPSLNEIYLNHNSIEGNIPDEISGLKDSLTSLCLNDNQFSGNIPQGFVSLKSLQRVELQANRLSGSLPSKLGDLHSLEYLQMDANMLSGRLISLKMDGLTNLRTMRLENNQFTGWLPDQIGDLTNLEVLRLNNNSKFGLTIPESWSRLTGLRELHLMDNDLDGFLPPNVLGNLSKLEELWLSNNRLHHGVPTQIGRMLALKTLYLDNNKLTGSLPAVLGSLSNLETLRLQNNHISGTMPAEVCDLKEAGSLQAVGADCTPHHGHTKVQCDDKCCTCS